VGQIWSENQGYADSGLRRSDHAVRGAEEFLNHVHDLAHPPEFEYPIPYEPLMMCILLLIGATTGGRRRICHAGIEL
jgi:hypothetical protein